MTSTLRPIIAELDKYMIEHGLTMSQAGAELGVTAATVSRWFKGAKPRHLAEARIRELVGLTPPAAEHPANVADDEAIIGNTPSLQLWLNGQLFPHIPTDVDERLDLLSRATDIPTPLLTDCLFAGQHWPVTALARLLHATALEPAELPLRSDERRRVSAAVQALTKRPIPVRLFAMHRLSDLSANALPRALGAGDIMPSLPLDGRTHFATRLTDDSMLGCGLKAGNVVIASVTAVPAINDLVIACVRRSADQTDVAIRILSAQANVELLEPRGVGMQYAREQAIWLKRVVMTLC